MTDPNKHLIVELFNNYEQHSQSFEGYYVVRSTTLPRVLSVENTSNSISMVRALKQIKELLEYTCSAASNEENNKINTSLDDIETMLKAIK